MKEEEGDPVWDETNDDNLDDFVAEVADRGVSGGECDHSARCASSVEYVTHGELMDVPLDVPVISPPSHPEDPRMDASFRKDETKTSEYSENEVGMNPNQELKYRLNHELLFVGYHENDVLSGRGATINAHPGNIHFRSMCAARKAEFNASDNGRKRQIATALVEEVLRRNPAGRFLMRVADIDLTDERVVEERGFCKKEIKAFRAAAGLHGNSKKARTHLGPWRDMGFEKAVQKAFQVVRDHKREDRIALRAMGMMKKAARSPQQQQHEEGGAATRDDSKAGGDHDPISPGETAAGGIIPTTHDVLSGRGAFINDHAGNRRFRLLAMERKAKFDSGNASEKRALSVEVVNLMNQLDPPGRFLKRPPGVLTTPVRLADGTYQLPPRGLQGPWIQMSQEQANQKACQVLRDIKINESDWKALAQLNTPQISTAGTVSKIDDDDDNDDHHQVFMGGEEVAANMATPLTPNSVHPSIEESSPEGQIDDSSHSAVEV